jgi:hypothetical protein
MNSNGIPRGALLRASIRQTWRALTNADTADARRLEALKRCEAASSQAHRAVFSEITALKRATDYGIAWSIAEHKERLDRFNRTSGVADQYRSARKQLERSMDEQAQISGALLRDEFSCK